MGEMFSNSLHYSLILLNSLVWFLCRKVNSRFTGKDPDAGKDWRQKEKETTEDETVGWLHWFNGHELGQDLGDGEGQGDLACCSPWGHKELDVTWWLNNNKASAPPPWVRITTQRTYNGKFGWKDPGVRKQVILRKPPDLSSFCRQGLTLRGHALPVSHGCFENPNRLVHSANFSVYSSY